MPDNIVSDGARPTLLREVEDQAKSYSESADRIRAAQNRGKS